MYTVYIHKNIFDLINVEFFYDERKKLEISLIRYIKDAWVKRSGFGLDFFLVCPIDFFIAVSRKLVEKKRFFCFISIIFLFIKC